MTMTRATVLPIAALLLLVASGGALAQRDVYKEEGGRDLYAHICQGCHMADGKGAAGAGAYPALAGNPKMAAKLYPVLVILKGQKAMPSFADLSDAQVAAVTNYVRGELGNRFPGAVIADDVKALRPQAVRQDALRPG